MTDYITNVTIDGTPVNIKDAETSNNLTAHINASNPHHIQVGGRNLLTNSKGEFSSGYPASGYLDIVQNTIKLPAGATQFVLSFEAKSTIAGDIIHSYFCNPSNIIRSEKSDGIVSTKPDGCISTTLTTNWKRYWVKWTAPIANTRTVIPARLINGDGTGTMSIRNIKLETGNVPTDWTPAPEDLKTTAITNAKIDSICK